MAIARVDCKVSDCDQALPSVHQRIPATVLTAPAVGYTLRCSGRRPSVARLSCLISLARAATVRASSRHYIPDGRLQRTLDNNASMAYLYSEEICQWRSDSVGMID